ncbi:Ribonuclease T2 precursor (RNase T2) [Gnomoniopsis sp. IMI 355080]|nr:Ribonuclease T2 precursor (RNase T2) [Gnomoniopsis sp. IMI 355080]
MRPANSWGIHGLWPDNCDGTYSEDCDSSREYTDITTLIEKYGTTELLDNMNTYWNSDDETNEEFWEHEWATHGTCVSTLDPSCYTDYETGIEAVDFFQITVDLFLSLVLYAAGIVPSSSKTYTSSAIISAISASFGQDPILLCDDDTLSSIYYGFYVDGPLLNADFVPAAIVGEDSTCPSSGISYPPKSGATTTVATTTAASTAVTSATSTSVVTTTAATTSSSSTTSTKKITLPGRTSTSTSTATTTSSGSTATGSSVSGEGYFYAYYDGSQDGELISEGTWYYGGTPATYHATASGDGFTIYTSKGDCAVTDGTFSCTGSTSGTFSLIDGLLAYDGSTAFYANEIPSGDEQATVSTESGSYSVTFEWSAI